MNQWRHLTTNAPYASSIFRLGRNLSVLSKMVRLLQRAFQSSTALLPITSFYHYFELHEISLDSDCAKLTGCDAFLVQDIQDVENYPLSGVIPSHSTLALFPSRGSMARYQLGRSSVRLAT